MQQQPSPEDLREHRRQLQEHKLTTWQVQTEWRAKAQELAVALSREAIKSIIVINGAAAIALLAFVGQALGKADHTIPLFAEPLRWFAGGAFAGALSAGVGYIAQLGYVEIDHSSRLWQVSTRCLHAASILIAFCGFCCFLYGAMLAADALEGVPQHLRLRGPVD